MRIWLEKYEQDGIINYYIFTKEPEWHSDAGAGDWSWLRPGWYRPAVEFDKHVSYIGKRLVEKLLPRAKDLVVGDLAEIELVNVGVWLPLSDDGDANDEGRVDPAETDHVWTLIPGRFVGEYDDEE